MSDKLPVELSEECRCFLSDEARKLDRFQLRTWIEEYVTRDIEYKVPVRITREWEAGMDEFSVETYHFDDDWTALESRIRRFETEHAWSENPPSRIRRHVSTVELRESLDGEFEVWSNLLVYRGHGDSTDAELISAERRDRLRKTEGQLKLAKRLVLLDHTHLKLRDLGIIL